ncbi:MAG: Cys-tRNA(Pro) deacylase [Firmicutes bacterium]|nr:Cys-tRNA(Pro) deacylase [[Eubacterium] siraeum]MCM1487668.1 Cys-tRNA(Pro) deacylase [Bacillota bacterium]
MSEAKTNAMRILEQNKISYLSHSYPHGKEPPSGAEVAQLLGQSPDRVFKTLVTKGGNDYYVFVLPVLKELDLKKAARAVGVKSVEMIPVKDINKVTGYIRGGCSPIGMKKQYQTVFASESGNIDTIIVSGGKIGLQIEVSVCDLVKLLNSSIKDITT